MLLLRHDAESLENPPRPMETRISIQLAPVVLRHSSATPAGSE
jgi:hypothetical protein